MSRDFAIPPPCCVSEGIARETKQIQGPFSRKERQELNRTSNDVGDDVPCIGLEMCVISSCPSLRC